MSNLTTDRAVKKAYFTALDGSHTLEFQFAPSELDFMEGGGFVDRLPTGSYFNELTWISGKPTNFRLRMFIDRTQESYIVEDYNQDPFEQIRRFPNRTPMFNADNILNFIEGIKNALIPREQGLEIRLVPSNYSASPEFKQRSSGNNSGVIPDLEALLYYVRPKGLKLSEITIQKEGSIKMTDFEQGRFTPPPMIRFYFGNIWKEGYITEVNYNLSVMNKQLTPRRLDADIKIACTRWGYLNDMSNEAIEGAISVKKST